MELSTREIERYQRQLILPDFSVEDQLKLKACSVAVVGAGGLAAGLLRYLCGMGFGTIYIFDDDCVDHSNLQRQVLYDVADIGKYKAKCTAAKLKEQNPDVTIVPIVERFKAKRASKRLKHVDLLIDACDNFATRYEIEQLAIERKIPWVFSSVFEYKGQLSVFNAKKGMQYSMLFPEPPEVDPTTKHGKIGMMPSLPGVMGAMQATEAFKIIVGKGELLDGCLLMYDSLTMNVDKIQLI